VKTHHYQVTERFAVLEEAADWHELILPQCIMRSLIACIGEQWAIEPAEHPADTNAS